MPDSGSGIGIPVGAPGAPAVSMAGCSGRYAEAWLFSLFWCPSSTMKGLDNGGGMGAGFLTDTQANFTNVGVKANQGMILYNLTTGLYGPVTAVTVAATPAHTAG